MSTQKTPHGPMTAIAVLKHIRCLHHDDIGLCYSYFIFLFLFKKDETANSKLRAH